MPNLPLSDNLLQLLSTEAARRGVEIEQVIRDGLVSSQSINPVDSNASHVRRIESDLRRRTQELRAVVENFPDPVLRLDRNMRYTFVNPANYNATGYTADELLGHTLPEIGASPDLAEKLEAALKRVLSTGEIETVHFDFRGPKGRKYFEARAVPEYNDEGVIDSVLVISHDVTAQTDLERQLRESETWYRGIVESQIDLVSRFTADLKLVFVNEAYRRYFGRPGEELVGRSILDLEDPKVHPAILAQRDLLLRDPSPQVNELLSYWPDGRARWIEWVTVGVPDESGVSQVFQSVGRDITTQRVLEQELRERETWYRGIVESQVDLVSRYTRDLKLVFVNDAYCRYFGGQQADFIGHSILEIEDPKVHATIIGHINEMINDPTPKVNEILSYWPDGRERWIQWVTCAVTGVDGSPQLFQAVGRDITAMRQLEKQLRERESWYRGIVESQIDLVSRHLPDTTLVFVNDAYCRYFGFTREQLIGKSFLITEPPQVHDSLLRKFRQTLQQPGPHIEENLSYHPDGRERWVQWMSYGFADENGTVTMVQSVGRDITEQKIAERVRRESEERFRAMLEAASEGIALIDSTDTIVQVNRYIEERFGYTRAQLIGQRCDFLFAPDTRVEIHAAIVETRETGESVDMHHTPPPMAQPSVGSPFPVEMTFVPLTVADRPMTMCLLVDITERQELEEQRLINRALEVELEKERELIDLKQRFTTMVTHEFRTPLAIIQSTIDIVQNYLDRLPPEKLAERLVIVTNQAKRMSDMLTGILTYSRGVQGLNPSTLEIIDLGVFCQSIIDDLTTADNDAHPIVLNVANPPVMLNTDRRLLEHVCLNLIGNAIKYSSEGSPVDVAVYREGTQLVLMVKDMGIGIPEGDLQRIYHPFHRADNVGTRSGSGLGLPIVKQCVDALGGTIEARSRVGYGTTFIVRLPEQAK